LFADPSAALSLDYSSVWIAETEIFERARLQRLLKKSLTFVAASRPGHFFRVERLFGIAFLVSAGLLFAPQTHYSLRLLRWN
jgi:hypothetical protein